MAPPEPAKLELTLARLAKLVGVGNVGSPQILDTHRPDSFQVKRFFVKNGAERKRRGDGETLGRGDGEKGRHGISESPAFNVPESSSPRVPGSPLLPIPVGFRIFRPPLRAMVDASRGYPLQLSAWGPNRSVYGKVVRLAGPWRKTGDWWRDDCWARDEWDVAVETRIGMAGEQRRTKLSHVLYRIYRELRSGAWFVEGAYD